MKLIILFFKLNGSNIYMKAPLYFCIDKKKKNIKTALDI